MTNYFIKFHRIVSEYLFGSQGYEDLDYVYYGMWVQWIRTVLSTIFFLMSSFVSNISINTSAKCCVFYHKMNNFDMLSYVAPNKTTLMIARNID